MVNGLSVERPVNSNLAPSRGRNFTPQCRGRLLRLPFFNLRRENLPWNEGDQYRQASIEVRNSWGCTLTLPYMSPV